jgi:hypothetical protein
MSIERVLAFAQVEDDVVAGGIVERDRDGARRGTGDVLGMLFLTLTTSAVSTARTSLP